MKKTQIILASASIGRKTLLKKLGLPFKIIPSTVDEDKITAADPYKMLQLRAQAKAEYVARKLNTKYKIQNTKYLVIAADSMAILDGKTYGKAKNKTDAKKILKALMGKTHTFATATCVVYIKSLKSPKELKTYVSLTKTRVSLRKLKDQSLLQYVNRYDFTKYAAGYALNETPWDLVTKIDGSYTNVIGLPFEVLLQILNRFKLL